MKLIIIFYGFIIGSFLNVCIYRIPKGEGVCFPASHCSKCSKKINWYDNIPVLSYLFLRGKCRNCNSNISTLYPLIEILNAIIYIVLYKRYGFNIEFIFFSFIMSVLIIIFFIDLRDMIIPDTLIIALFILEVFHKVALFLLNGQNNLKTSIFAAILAGLLFLFIVVISSGGMGEGDVTLVSSLGFILGAKLILVCIFLSFIIGAIVSIILLWSGVKTIKDPIPFAPFIIISFFIVLLYGNTIIDLYMSLFI